jgi:hypothetical protein
MNKLDKLVLALAILGVIGLTRPATADAHFSLSIGLPGFGLIIHEPYPPPVAYAPPAYYPPPVAYYGYRPAPVYFQGRYRPGCHRGWYGRGRRWR